MPCRNTFCLCTVTLFFWQIYFDKFCYEFNWKLALQNFCVMNNVQFRPRWKKNHWPSEGEGAPTVKFNVSYLRKNFIFGKSKIPQNYKSKYYKVLNVMIIMFMHTNKFKVDSLMLIWRQKGPANEETLITRKWVSCVSSQNWTCNSAFQILNPCIYNLHRGCKMCATVLF